MPSATETELKFEADALFRVPDLPGLTVVAEHDLELRATYWDTDARRLLSWGVTLRHRMAGDGSEDGWTLKLPASARNPGLAVRNEIDSPGTPVSPPTRLVELVRAITLDHRLVPVATITTSRHTVRLGAHVFGAALELADDTVESTIGGAPGPSFREIEVELLDEDHVGALEDVARELQAAGLCTAEHRSKLEHVLGAPEQSRPVSPRLDPRSTLDQLVRALFERAASQLTFHDAGVRLGHDAEAVHQARVATRRLRGELRMLKPYLRREEAAHLRAELRWLAGLLGDVRDTQVLRARLHGAAEALDPENEADRAELDDRLRSQCEFRRAPLLSALSGSRYLELLTALWLFAAGPPFRNGAPVDARALPLVRRRARRSWTRVRRTVRKLGAAPTDTELHSLRKRIKESRYAAQTAQLAGASAKPFTRGLGALQDELGDLHDAVVAMGWLEDEGGLFTPSTAFLAGRLHHQADERRGALHATWRDGWDEADLPARREWMG